MGFEVSQAQTGTNPAVSKKWCPAKKKKWSGWQLPSYGPAGVE